MSETSREVVLSFQGRGELAGRPGPPRRSRAAADNDEEDDEQAPQDSRREPPDYALIAAALTRDADELAQQVESELLRCLPPGVGTLVHLSFCSGSLEVAGVATLLFWATPATTASALEKLVGFSVERVVHQWIRRHR